MNFIFKKSARIRCVSTIIFSFPILLFGSTLLIFCSVIPIYSFFIEEDANLFNLIIGIGGFLIAIVWIRGFYSAVTWIYNALKYGGCWNIEITNTEIIWDAPDFTTESFRVRLLDVSKILKILVDDEYISTTSYFIKTLNGENIELDSFSGIDLNLFMETLVDKGIKYEHVTK